MTYTYRGGRVDQATIAELAAWNAANERARREYRLNPITTNGRRSAVSDDRMWQPCARRCGRTTRARAGVCLVCRNTTSGENA